MGVLYRKPEVMSYAENSILEELGLCQNQYEQTTTLNPAGDNWIYRDWEFGDYELGSNYQGGVYPIVVGCSENGTLLRGFFNFDISSIQSTVVSATLKIYQISAGSFTTSGAPYSRLGNLTVDHVNFVALTEDRISTAFDGYDITRNISSTSDSTDNSWKEFDVKSAVQADIDAGRNTSQFRMRFATNTSGFNDNIFIEDVDNHGGSGNKPELVVTYNQ